MAFLIDCVCSMCNQPFQGCGCGDCSTRPDVCSECERQEEHKKLMDFLHTQSALPLDQRLRQIEKWIYELRNRDDKSIYDMTF
jgi:hypothetical protein